MPTYRKISFVNDQLYHLYNRGIEGKSIFTTKWEFQRALKTLKYYQFKTPPLRLSKFLLKTEAEQLELLRYINKEDNKLIEIIAFCLMPNHFHFLVKQTLTDGIPKFISNFCNSYTKYFNTKHKRLGPLFQGSFKAVLVESDEQLIHLSRYIHLNPISSAIIKGDDLEKYFWSSYREYLNLENEQFSSKSNVLSFFKSPKDYKKFVLNQVSLAKELDKIKHLTFEG